MKKILLLLAITATSTSFVIIGGLLTVDKTRFRNDFIRLFPPHAADVNSVFNISQAQLAGLTARHVYLYDRSGVIEIDLKTKDTSRITVEHAPGSEIIVDSPHFFIHNGSTKSIQRGRISNWSIDSTYYSSVNFTSIQFISPNDFIFRSMDIPARKNLLTKFSSSSDYILRKQVDGLLCTDGLLQYSDELKQLIYVYRYRNQYICLDTSLNVVGFGQTIDTTSRAKIAVAEMDGKITMVRPPLNVNNDAIVDGKYLFVQSNLVAKNEVMERAKGRTVIDVYNIADKSYRFSFYIENYGNAKMEGFRVKDSIFAAVFNNAVVIYDLPSIYVP